MIRLPLSYMDGNEQVMYDYYGRFIWHIAQRNHLTGMYGMTGDMIDEALKEYGAHLGDNDLMFNDDRMSTLFILRWSK